MFSSYVSRESFEFFHEDSHTGRRRIGKIQLFDPLGIRIDDVDNEPIYEKYV